VRRWLIAGALVVAAMGGISAQTTTLDYDYFKTKVQPILVAKRTGHARCISCHGSGTPLRLQPIAPGAEGWTDEDSQKNFQAIRRVSSAGAKSRLILHPLEEKAGGDFYHSGGKHWTSQDDPEWKVLLAFVQGATK
jgi:hypothetical protein